MKHQTILDPQLFGVETEFPSGDLRYEQGTILDVVQEEEGWEIHIQEDGFKGGPCFFLEKPSPVEPRPGQRVRTYGDFGHPIRGVFLDGKKIWYRTEAEQDEVHRKMVEKMDQDDKDRFERYKDEYFEKISKLPKVFQDRFARFRESNPKFDYKYGGYELFCCEQAVVIAEQLKTEEAILEWSKSSFKNQMSLPGISDGHSGNSFGCSVILARLYITSPEFVTKMHGALTPLVGCEEYGCKHG